MSDFIRNKNAKPLPNSQPKKNNTRRVAISIIIFTIIGSILGFISFGWLIYGNFKKSSVVAHADEITTNWTYTGNMYCWYFDQPDVKGIKFRPVISFYDDYYNVNYYNDSSSTVINNLTWYSSFIESGLSYRENSSDEYRFYQYYRTLKDAQLNSIRSFSNTDFTGTISNYHNLITNDYSLSYSNSYQIEMTYTNPDNYYSLNNTYTFVKSCIYFTSYGSKPTSFDSVHIYRDAYLSINNNTDFIVFNYYYNGSNVFSFFIGNYFYLSNAYGNNILMSFNIQNIRDEWRYFTTFNADFNDGVAYGRSQGLIDGENLGYEKGYRDGNNAGRIDGYNDGYLEGIEDANDYSFLGLMSSIVDAPIQAFRGLFTFNVFGVDMTDFLLSIFSLCIVVAVIKMFV